MSPFDALAKDQVTIEKVGSSTIGPFKAAVTAESVVIFSRNADVAEGDVVCRRLPNGRTDRLVVTEATFYQDMAGIPANWQLKYRKGVQPKPAGTQITINNPQGVQIGDHNSQVIIGAFEQLVREIDASAESDEEKAEAKGRLKLLLRHPPGFHIGRCSDLRDPLQSVRSRWARPTRRCRRTAASRPPLIAKALG